MQSVRSSRGFERMAEEIRLNEIRFQAVSVVVEVSILEEPLVIDLETAHRFRLAAGTVITPSQLAALEAAALRYACRNEATRLLALRPHAVEELRLKLRRREFPDEIVGETIDDFKQRGVLDDAQYAHELAQSLVARKPCGRAYLVGHLQSKHIDRFLAAEVADVVLGPEDATELAIRALSARWREFGQFDLETARRKAYNYLARRGFTFDATQAAFESLATESTDGGQD